MQKNLERINLYFKFSIKFTETNGDLTNENAEIQATFAEIREFIETAAKEPNSEATTVRRKYVYTIVACRGNIETFFPPPRNWENRCRNLMLFSKALYLVKNVEKSQFSIEILIKKAQNFLKNFL